MLIIEEGTCIVNNYMSVNYKRDEEATLLLVLLGLFRPKQLGYIGILVMHFYIKKRKVEKTKKQVPAGFEAMIF